MVVKKKPAPQKKAGPPKKATRRKKQKTVVFNELKKILVGITILVSVCLTVAMIADLFFQPGRSEKKQAPVRKPVTESKIKPAMDNITETIAEDIRDAQTKKPGTGLKEKSDKPIKYEVFEDIDQTILIKPPPPEKDKIPKIVIIIDDIGYDKKIALAFSDLNPDITFSILPFSPFGTYLSEKLHARGAQLMLHLPMEPVDYPDVDPGPGAILFSMTPDVLLDQVKKNIQAVPYVVGVNNHMGSKLTTRSDQMNQIFTVLKKENLFFIDSRTAPKSQGQASARLFKLKFAHRDVFLDNIQDTTYIAGQLRELVDLAIKHGSAIGIGHPYGATLQTLSEELPKLKNKVDIVRANTLTEIPG